LALLALLALGAPGAGTSQGSAAQERSCGRSVSSDRPVELRRKSRCLAQAFGRGSRATLVAAHVDRGGRVLTEKHYRVLHADRLEVFVDVRTDRFGAQRWHRYVCTDLRTPRGLSLAPRRCTETPLTATGAQAGPRYRDCGRSVKRGIEPGPAFRAGNRCLVEAFERGERAMFVTTLPTLEGDPTTWYFAVLGLGRVEYLVDAIRDRYSVPHWHRALCTAVSLTPRGSLDFRDCRHSTFRATFPRHAAAERSCGYYASSDQPVQALSKSRCLLQAFRRGTRATLVVTRVDRKGDVLTENHYRVLGVNRLELFVDVREARVEARRWRRFICRELVVRPLAARRCVETSLTATGSQSARHVNCGRFARRPLEPISPEELEGHRCLFEAFQRGEPALLATIVYLALEGQMIPTYYAVLGPRRVERLLDATRALYSVPQWNRFVCNSVSLHSTGTLNVPVQDCRYSVLPPTFPHR
jgi:hypothetical protein